MINVAVCLDVTSPSPPQNAMSTEYSSHRGVHLHMDEYQFGLLLCSHAYLQSDVHCLLTNQIPSDLLWYTKELLAFSWLLMRHRAERLKLSAGTRSSS